MSPPRQLERRLKGKVIFVGVGNPVRGDDAAGNLVAHGLETSPRLGTIRAAQVIEAEEVPENFVGQIVAAHPDTVVLIDAVDMDAEPGAIALIERDQVANYCPTTHRMPLSLIMTYVQEETGADIFLLAIQPRQVGFGAPVSREVGESVALLVAIFEKALAAKPAAQSVWSGGLAGEGLA